MDNSSRFFENRDCEYYPCHKGLKEINCLFCYCPLYDRVCPGRYFMKEKEGKKIKSCIDCDFPHIPENYDKIMRILADGSKGE
ncbi:MAG: cysteine-rich small domain-containing protein [Lachnospiraceae bacterium]|nr:cysteine-rich small domain-containing protein [Lachnospiraceae bacterium]